MKRIVIIVSALALLLSACASAPEALPTREPEPETLKAPADDATLEKLTVVSRPDKTAYLSGETFDAAGLRIDALYSDGGVVENVPFEVEDPLIRSRATTVAISCLGKTLNISIEVVAAGNAEAYSVANTETVADSPVKGNVYLWLGSSVTYGAASEGESMADFFAKKWDCVCIKEAVSGTTLTTKAPNSYVERLDKYIASADRAERLDGFICQLSTNDTRYADSYGLMMPSFITGADAFDTGTTLGAIEYIIAAVKETWDCPVYFYISPPYSNANYEKLVESFMPVAEKWNVKVIDMFHDADFNAITDAERAVYMDDAIHPTKAGYREWWLKKFETVLLPEKGE